MGGRSNIKLREIIPLVIGVGAWSLFSASALAVPDDASGNGANTSGVYDATGVQGPGPGLGEGNAVGRPDDGAVGNADNKNPPGQLPGPEDANVGYECEAGPNHGVGLGNPAHTTCGSTEPTPVLTPPAVTPGSGTDPTVTDPGASVTPGDPVVPPGSPVPPVPGISTDVTPPTGTGGQDVPFTPVAPAVGTVAPVGILTPVGATPPASPGLLGATPVSPGPGVSAPETSRGTGVNLLAAQLPGTLGSPVPGAAAVPSAAGAVAGGAGVDQGATLAQRQTAQSPAATATRGTLAATGRELTRMVLVSLFMIALGAAFLSRTSSPAATRH